MSLHFARLEHFVKSLWESPVLLSFLYWWSLPNFTEWVSDSNCGGTVMFIGKELGCQVMLAKRNKKEKWMPGEFFSTTDVLSNCRCVLLKSMFGQCLVIVDEHGSCKFTNDCNLWTQQTCNTKKSVANPGFPVGEGGADLRCICFTAKMYVKRKNWIPLGEGRTPAAPLPGSANGMLMSCTGKIPGHFMFFNYIIQILLLVLTSTRWLNRIAILHPHWNTMEGKLFI